MTARAGRRAFLRLSPLLLLVLALALLCGQGALLGALAAALMAHEAAHLLAARLLRVGVSSLEIHPFGAVARLVAPGGGVCGEAAVAACGPVASFFSPPSRRQCCNWLARATPSPPCAGPSWASAATSRT